MGLCPNTSINVAPLPEALDPLGLLILTQGCSDPFLKT